MLVLILPVSHVHSVSSSQSVILLSFSGKYIKGRKCRQKWVNELKCQAVKTTCAFYIRILFFSNPIHHHLRYHYSQNPSSLHLQWARLLFGLCHSLSQFTILPSFFLFYFISFESSSKQKLCVRFTYFFSFLAAYYSRHHHHRHRPHRRFLLCAQSAVSSTTTFDIVPYAISLQ